MKTRDVIRLSHLQSWRTRWYFQFQPPSLVVKSLLNVSKDPGTQVNNCTCILRECKVKKVKSAYKPRGAHQAGACSSFCRVVFPQLPVHCRVTPSIKFSRTHLYSYPRLERGTVLLKNTAQCPWPGLEPGQLNLEMSALTIRPPNASTHECKQWHYCWCSVLLPCGEG